MHRSPRVWLLLALALALAASSATSQAAATLQPYRDEDQFSQAMQRWRVAAQQLQAERRRAAGADAMMLSAAPQRAATPAAAALESAAADSGAANNSITNVQTAGVDEGGIVKRAGDHLIVLRRGRLFTLRMGGDQLQPQLQAVSSIDAYAPGANPQGAWYDELLVSGRDVVVIGYSYARGGTEIGWFEIGSGGSLSYRATWHLRGSDYYSSRNYASRLIGRKLIFYSPTLLQPWGPAPGQAMPAMRRWFAGVPDDFQRILPATRIYRSDDDFDAAEPLALHTVTSCDLGDANNLRCEASAVLGPQGRVFYVSQGAVYVWTSRLPRRRGWPAPWPQAESPADARGLLSAVFRLPLQGAAPSMLKTAGVPVDQMSFLEDKQGQLNVLLREHGDGEGMFGAEHGHGQGRLALLRVPLSAFGDGSAAATRDHYRRLPGPEAGRGGSMQNRFVGDWLLWGTHTSAWALRYADGGAAAARLSPGHAVERIEALGEHALLVGNAGGELQFSAVALGRGDARIAGKHVHAGGRQGETRTHGFFYRPTGSDEGLLGLPVLGTDSGPRHGVHSRGQGAAAVVFLRQRDLSFGALGRLETLAARPADDGCKVSCVDWYGNARPIFIGERVFALMGYELVEGRLDGGRNNERIVETRRVNFAPHVRGRDSRANPFE